MPVIAIDGSPLGSGRGGDETFMRGLLAGIASDPTHEFHFVVIIADDFQPDSAMRDAANLEFVSTPRAGGWRRLTSTLPRLLRRLDPTPALIVAVNHGPLFSRVPQALVIADVSFLRHPEHYPRLTSLRLRTTISAQVRRAALVITVSEFSKSEIVGLLGVTADRVAVVPNRVESPNLFDPVPVTPTQAGRGAYVLYLGNLHPRKNVSRLCRAFMEAQRESDCVRGMRLLIAGRPWFGGDAEISSQIADADGAIEMLGPVTEPEKDELIRQASALAYPSYYEGFGLPPLEAMARGTPVLAANAGSLPEVLGDAALFVDPADTAAISAGLVQIISDEPLRRRLISAGHSRAELFGTSRVGAAATEAFARALSAGAVDRERA